MTWIKTAHRIPPDGKVVMTKIEDHNGVRNEQELKRIKNLWWFPDGSMYVYYNPTHWLEDSSFVNT